MPKIVAPTCRNGYNDHMQTQNSSHLSVGSRELKTRLGTYLRQVRQGATLVVTDRGRPVAELRPLSLETQGLEGRLERLAARGVLVMPEGGQRQPFEELEPLQNAGASLTDAILKDREDRI